MNALYMKFIMLQDDSYVIDSSNGHPSTQKRRRNQRTEALPTEPFLMEREIDGPLLAMNSNTTAVHDTLTLSSDSENDITVQRQSRSAPKR